jgi:hypothetical protein
MAQVREGLLSKVEARSSTQYCQKKKKKVMMETTEWEKIFAIHII